MKPQPTYFRLLPGQTPVAIGGSAPAEPAEPTLRDLLGEAAWSRLAPAVRARFATTPRAGDPWLFRGLMDRVECSPVGRTMAWASRAAGAPVAHLSGRDIPVDVLVYAEGEGGGTVWRRTYEFNGHRRVVAATTKRIDADRQLLEVFAMGLGMELNVSEHEGALHFRSTSFYAELFGRRFRLPHLLSPGTLLVEHVDEGGGMFRFRMRVDHKSFGRVFFQDGLFRQVDASELVNGG